MLEIPESRTVAAQINETVQGKRIREVEAAHTPHAFAWYSGDPAFYAEVMEGREIGRAVSIGSMIELELGDHSFVMGDGTNVRYLAPGQKLPQKYQTRITLEDDSSIICTVQMYGSMFLIQPRIYDNPYYLAGKQTLLIGRVPHKAESALRQVLLLRLWHGCGLRSHLCRLICSVLFFLVPQNPRST